jgi:hypothetical protein
MPAYEFMLPDEGWYSVKPEPFLSAFPPDAELRDTFVSELLSLNSVELKTCGLAPSQVLRGRRWYWAYAVLRYGRAHGRLYQAGARTVVYL